MLEDKKTLISMEEALTWCETTKLSSLSTGYTMKV